MAAAPQRAHWNTRLLNIQSALFAAALLLPGLAPALFGWLSGLLAIPVFCLLCVNGRTNGTRLLLHGTVLAAAAAVILKLMPSLLFSLTMVPLGYSFSNSYQKGETEVQAGAKGLLVLSLAWVVFWTGYGAIKGISPYQQLLESQDALLVQFYEYHSKNADLPAEKIAQLEELTRMTRRIAPFILPGILSCMVLITVWVNLLVSSLLARKMEPGKAHWNRYGQWRLPDKFVWFFIGSAILLLVGHEKIGSVAFAVFLSAALLYFFQGLAVFSHLLEKWNVPGYLRIILYAIILLQYISGLIVLTLLGLADVWFNFRRTQTIDKPDEQ